MFRRPPPHINLLPLVSLIVLVAGLLVVGTTVEKVKKPLTVEELSERRVNWAADCMSHHSKDGPPSPETRKRCEHAADVFFYAIQKDD